jgi:hypothetical protein
MAIDPGDLTDATDDTAPPTGQQRRELPPLTPETLHAELQSVRSEAARYRMQNRDLRKLLSTVSGEEVPEGRPAPDLATLQKRFESLTAGDKATIRTLKIQKHLLTTSHKHGIEDPEYLEFALSKSGSLSDMDPDAEGFVDDLDTRVEELLENRPEVRGRQGVVVPSPNTAQFRPTTLSTGQLSRAAVSSMSPEEISAALASGQLNALLGRKGGA